VKSQPSRTSVSSEDETFLFDEKLQKMNYYASSSVIVEDPAWYGIERFNIDNSFPASKKITTI
jgi:hypothetical protein